MGYVSGALGIPLKRIRKSEELGISPGQFGGGVIKEKTFESCK